MVNNKTILMTMAAIVAASMIAGCGKENDSEAITPRDAKTGKTFSNSNEMLAAVKAERPFEYDIVYEITKDNPEAMKSYEKYNSSTTDIFENVKYVGKEGSELSKENFDKELEKQNNFLKTLLDLLPIGVFMVEAPSGKPVIANETAKKLLGRGILPDASKTNLGDIYQAYYSGTDIPYSIEEMPIIKSMSGQKSHIDNMEVLRPDGTRILL
ncbi:MAG: hypothetical protein HGA95_04630, partial [Caldiserica bacterium]|nr:hypothetical protein [Caldisericota bacterium]